MHKEQKVVYYRDELNDEFSDGHIDAKKIDGNYRYIRDDSPIGKVVHIFWYRIIATPLAWLYMKLHFHHKIVNRQVLKMAEGAYYIYGNHTHFLADALVPTMVNFPKDVSVIVHRIDTLSGCTITDTSFGKFTIVGTSASARKCV